MEHSTAATPQPASPISDLQQILSDAGEDISVLFGPTLSAYAGALANTKSDDQKYDELERLIMGYEK
jgi:hypothetical protein